MTLQYMTLQYITLHYITLHYITLHYITLHYITLHYITLHYITLHYITLHYITIHCQQHARTERSGVRERSVCSCTERVLVSRLFFKSEHVAPGSFGLLFVFPFVTAGPTMSSSGARSSRNVVVQAAIDALPLPLKTALKGNGLDKPGVLKCYPRASVAELGLRPRVTPTLMVCSSSTISPTVLGIGLFYCRGGKWKVVRSWIGYGAFWWWIRAQEGASGKTANAIPSVSVHGAILGTSPQSSRDPEHTPTTRTTDRNTTQHGITIAQHHTTTPLSPISSASTFHSHPQTPNSTTTLTDTAISSEISTKNTITNDSPNAQQKTS